METEQNILEPVRIKKIGVISFANLFGMTGFFVGLIFGLLILLSSLFVPNQADLGMFGLFLSGFAIIIFPILYGVFGWISGIIYGFLYNVSARITKGIVLYS